VINRRLGLYETAEIVGIILHPVSLPCASFPSHSLAE
jgi:hypothetical protein